MAIAYHGLYQRQKTERLDRLASIYNRLGQPNDLIVMLFCSTFFPLFENWLASCDANGIEVRQRLIAFTLDEESDSRTRTLGVESYFLDQRLYGAGGGSSRYADQAFSRTMFYKNAIVFELLHLGAGILFQDVDCVWLRDPLGYFSGQDNKPDICCMYDGPNPRHRPLYANTGFIYSRSSNATRAFFESALRNTGSVFQGGSHQAPFNRLLAHFVLHNVLSVQILPEQLFANGHLFNIEEGVSEAVADWRERAFVVHYSWTRNMAAKRQKMNRFDLDYLRSRTPD